MNSTPSFHTRREFLRTGLLGGALTWTVPSFLAQTFQTLHAQAASSALSSVTGKDSPILIVLQLAGGNDGLNTVVPYANDYYFKARPTLALKPDAILKIDDQLGLHAKLAPLKALYDAGEMSIVNGVGYPNPNRSHFRSTEIWQTASDAEKFERYGWLGRYFDHACSGQDPTCGISIGRERPQAFASKIPSGISLDNPENYRYLETPGTSVSSENLFRQLNQMDSDPDSATENTGGSIGAIAGTAPQTISAADFLERTALDAQVSSDQILAASRKVQNMAAYPNSSLANNLKLIARLIGGGMSSQIFYASQGGYDTHTRQAGPHERLLTDVAASLKAFTDDLKAQGNFGRVLIMTFSEFGRRVAQNGSGGTDHGAAAPLFLIGGKVKAGLHGAYPSLAPADLLDGDLRHGTDFRSVYATVLEDWLKTSSMAVMGRTYPKLALV
jgi:uncharacterized protein (DUF1501 family)